MSVLEKLREHYKHDIALITKAKSGHAEVSSNIQYKECLAKRK